MEAYVVEQDVQIATEPQWSSYGAPVGDQSEPVGGGDASHHLISHALPHLPPVFGPSVLVPTQREPVVAGEEPRRARNASEKLHNLFVGDLDSTVDTETLIFAFSSFPTVYDAKVVMDPRTGRSLAAPHELA